ncbi:MAG: FluC/FEX family fluoride channel [Chitinophagales bacterium]
MAKLLIIFCCTGFGGIFRYLFSFVPYVKSGDHGVLVSNIVACAIMGCLLAIPVNNPIIRIGIASFCGGLSTFSGYIAFSCLSAPSTSQSLFYHFASIGMGLVFFMGSYYSCKSLFA